VSDVPDASEDSRRIILDNRARMDEGNSKYRELDGPFLRVKGRPRRGTATTAVRSVYVVLCHTWASDGSETTTGYARPDMLCVESVLLGGGVETNSEIAL
jgi:hypothetical protein